MSYLNNPKIYAFDFDGTLCKEAYPYIGSPNKRVIRMAKRCKKNGHRIILWTCRSGQQLEEAVIWCKEQGIEFDAVNQNLPEITQLFGSDSRKITADYYIDDKMLWSHSLILSAFT